MRRKLLCVFVLCISFVMYSSLAYADTCSHHWVEATGPISSMYESVSDTNHQIVTYVKFVCTKCGVNEWRQSTYVTPVLESHSFTYVKDLGHGVGTDHFYLYQCLSCGHQKVVTSICNGPPCFSVGYGILLPDVEIDE